MKKDKQFVAVLLLMAVLTGILGVSVGIYHSIERNSCAERFQAYALSSGDDILNTLQRSESYLSKMAGTVYDRFRLSETSGIQTLSALGNFDIITRMELLLPDNTLYTTVGQVTNHHLDFNTLAAQGAHASHRVPNPQNPSSYIVRLFCPVREGGKTVAILSGVVELDTLSYRFPTDAYDGQAWLCIAEGSSGDYLLNPKTRNLGNIRDLSGTKTSRRDDVDVMLQKFEALAPGTVTYQSPESGGDCLAAYVPIGYQDWMVVLSVPKRVVYAHSNLLLIVTGSVALLSLLLCALFLVWLSRELRRRQAQEELRMRSVHYILDVQQVLFRAHAHAEQFQEALEMITTYLNADVALFYVMGPDGRLVPQSIAGSASKAPPRTANFRVLFPQVTATTLSEGRFMGTRPFLWGDKDWQSAREIGIRSMMLVRLDKLNGNEPLGVLCAINADVLWEDTTPLDQVSLVFSMALENYENYQTLAYLGQVDELTGLMNRNSYETTLDKLAKNLPTALACVYIDVNGLHEINNHLGHDAGDEMLRTVADALRSSFPRKEDIFRLGGDEFAVFCSDMPMPDIERRVDKVLATVEKAGYAISVGVERRSGEGVDVAAIVAAAEKTMRDNKAQYYASHGGERQMRLLNSRLEQTLTAKRDADTLLSYLAPSFKGVYCVDPAKDTCRSIVLPPYFEDILHRADGKYSAAMALYAAEQVHPDFRARFSAFCEMDTLLPLLHSQGKQELMYQRADGAWYLVQVMEPRRAGDNHQEIMWLFTNVPDPKTAN